MNRELVVMERVVTCTNCERHDQCGGPIPFAGKGSATVAVVKATPIKEDEEGTVAYRSLAEDILMGAGLSADRLFSMNAVACRGTAAVSPEHVVACHENFNSQLQLSQAKVVVLLGEIPLYAVDRNLDFKALRGCTFRQDGRTYFVMESDAVAIRRPDIRREMKEQCQRVNQIVDGKKWSDFVAEKCHVCSEWANWWDERAIASCIEHAPPECKEWMGDRWPMPA